MKSIGLFLILMTLVLSACTEKGKPYSPNAPDQRTESTDTLGAVPAATRSSTPQIASSVSLTALAAQVLSPARIRDPRAMVDNDIRDQLTELNRRILATPQTQRGRADFLKTLAQYKNALFTDCGNYKDSCTGLRYFRRAANSYEVVKLIAWNDQRQPDFFKLADYASEIKGSVWDADLLELIIESHANPKDADIEAMHSLVATTVLLSQSQITNPDLIRRFLSAIHVWELLQNQKLHLDATTKSAIYHLIASSGYLFSSGNSPTADFARVIQAQVDLPNGLISREKTLRAENLMNPKALSAQYVNSLDPTDYLIDAVFTGSLSSQSAADLFAGTGMNDKTFTATVENYIRLQFLASLTKANSMIKKIVVDQNIPVEELIPQVISQSVTIRQEWDAMNTGLLNVKDFAFHVLRQQDPADLKTLDDMFDSTPSQIELAAVYPHLMVLFYQLSKQHFSVTLPSTGGTVDASDLLTDLFKQMIGPVLPYSTDHSIPNSFQLIYSFDYAVRTNLFQTVGIDPDAFIADVLNRLSEKSVNMVSQVLDTVQDSFTNNPDFGQFADYCQEFKTGQLVEHPFPLTELPDSPYYGTLSYKIFQTLSGASTASATDPGELPKKTDGLLFTDNMYNEMIERTRLDLTFSTRIAHAMLVSYQNFLSQYAGMNAKQIAQKTVLTRAALTSVDQVVRRVLTSSKAWIDKYQTCYYHSALRDIEVQRQVLAAEIAYLRHIHREIKNLRDSGARAADVAQANAKIQFQNLPGGFTGLDRISKNGYLYDQIDAEIRITQYLKYGYHDETTNIAPIAPNVKINLGERLDSTVTAVKNSAQKFLPYVDSEDDFVGNGMRVLAASSSLSPWMDWLDNRSGHLASWQYDMEGLVSLKRLEADILGTDTYISDDEILNEQRLILSMVRLSPFDRSYLNLIHDNQNVDTGEISAGTLLRQDADLDIIGYRGLFDYPVRMMESEFLGWSFDSPENSNRLRLGYKGLGLLYFQSRAKIDRGVPVIPFSPSLDDYLDRSIYGFVHSEVSAIGRFVQHAQNYVEKMGALPADQKPRVDLSLTQSITSPMLTPSLVSDFDADLLKFNQQTDSCFASPNLCPDFK